MGNTYGRKKKEMPVGSFHFGIEIDGIFEGSFLRVTGIASEIEVEEYKEGGMNHFVHYMPVRVKYSNIILEKGVTKSKELLKWFNQVKEGIMNKKNFSIVLWNNGGEIIRRWNFQNGYPIKWEASDLDAMGNSILIEKIELTHEGMNENS